MPEHGAATEIAAPLFSVVSLSLDSYEPDFLFTTLDQHAINETDLLGIVFMLNEAFLQRIPILDNQDVFETFIGNAERVFVSDHLCFVFCYAGCILLIVFFSLFGMCQHNDARFCSID